MSRIPAQSPPHRGVARGSVDTTGRLMVACRFDEALFEAIYCAAASQNISFAEQVRRLCLVGLAVRAEKIEHAA
jgi:hypothetical protein